MSTTFPKQNCDGYRQFPLDEGDRAAGFLPGAGRNVREGRPSGSDVAGHGRRVPRGDHCRQAQDGGYCCCGVLCYAVRLLSVVVVAKCDARKYHIYDV